MTTAPHTEPALRFRAVAKTYGDNPAVCSVDLDVAAGEVLTVIGPSGCGKSTLLRLAAGLERPDGGTVELEGREVAGSRWVPPEKRRVGLVFQDHALFPHLDVATNIAFGLDRLPRVERAPRVAEVLELVGLGELGRRYPHELSGGEQQRVALARAFMNRPKILFCDEPTGNLDDDTAAAMAELIFGLNRERGTTLVLVTHNLDLARRCQRVIRLKGGTVISDEPTGA